MQKALRQRVHCSKTLVVPDLQLAYDAGGKCIVPGPNGAISYKLRPATALYIHEKNSVPETVTCLLHSTFQDKGPVSLTRKKLATIFLIQDSRSEEDPGCSPHPAVRVKCYSRSKVHPRSYVCSLHVITVHLTELVKIIREIETLH
jgi:hypothetical protein